MMQLIRSLGAALAGSVLFVVLLAVLAATQASGPQAAPAPYEQSYFDYSFGREGVATMPITGYGLQVRQLDNGKVLLWRLRPGPDKDRYWSQSANSLIQLNADGSLDTHFGINGVVQLTSDSSRTYVPFSNGKGFLIQSDGKIIVRYDNGTLVRYARGGMTDTTYGLNGAAPISGSGGDFIGDLRAIQADDKLILSLQDFYYNGSYILYRLNTDGTLDSSFGVSGTLYPGYALYLGGIALLPDGSLVLAHGNNARDDSGTRGFCNLEHYSRDGQSLGPFTSSSRLCFGGLQQPDGKLLVIPYTNSHALTRLNVDGSIDTTFGTSGTAQMDPLPRIVQRDGTLLGITRTAVPTQTLVHNFAVVRYQSNGKVDRTFADQGQLNVPIAHVPPYNTGSFAYDIALGLNNTFLVSGMYDSGYLEHVQFPYVVRIRNTPVDIYRTYLPSTVLRQ